MHAGEYIITNFTPIVKAMNLYEHVDLITSNPNKFPEYEEQTIKSKDGTVTKVFIMRQDSLVNKVRKQAYEIYALADSANMINLNYEPWRKEERLRKQSEAIAICEDHLSAIQLCRKHFHLSYRKIKHWGKMTIDVRDSIKHWHNGDVDRYKEI